MPKYENWEPPAKQHVKEALEAAISALTPEQFNNLHRHICTGVKVQTHSCYWVKNGIGCPAVLAAEPDASRIEYMADMTGEHSGVPISWCNAFDAMSGILDKARLRYTTLLDMILPNDVYAAVHAVASRRAAEGGPT